MLFYAIPHCVASIFVLHSGTFNSWMLKVAKKRVAFGTAFLKPWHYLCLNRVRTRLVPLTSCSQQHDRHRLLSGRIGSLSTILLAVVVFFFDRSRQKRVITSWNRWTCISSGGMSERKRKIFWKDKNLEYFIKCPQIFNVFTILLFYSSAEAFTSVWKTWILVTECGVKGPFVLLANETSANVTSNNRI